MKRPIDVWPPVRRRGSPGYSAAHYAAVSPAADDPLRVAERILARADAAEVAAETRRKLEAGEPFEAICTWQSDTLSARATARWERLCNSLPDVIAALESAPTTPGMKALLRDARRQGTK